MKEAPAGGACGEPPQRTKSFPAPELSSRAQNPSSPLPQEMFVPKNKTELLLVPEASESMTKAPAASLKGGMTSVTVANPVRPAIMLQPVRSASESPAL